MILWCLFQELDYHFESGGTSFLFSTRSYFSSTMAGHVLRSVLCTKVCVFVCAYSFQFYPFDVCLPFSVSSGSSLTSNHTQTPTPTFDDEAPSRKSKRT
jgi:hypothetical protein